MVAATVAAAVALAWAMRAFDARGVWFAFIVVWLPMAWLGTVSRWARPRLPRSYFALRTFEQDGQVYERLGVTVVKAMLRRGPIARFNADLHLPAVRTPESLARLDQRMRDAEASHAILFAATLGVAIHAGARGWLGAAAWTTLFDVLLNGYPVMLQRYNRALLRQRFAGDLADATQCEPVSSRTTRRRGALRRWVG